METLFDEAEKGNRRVEEISREEEKQRHVERVDQSLDEQGDDLKIIVSQNDEQDSDAFCDVKIFNSFGHEEVSSALILPRCKSSALSGGTVLVSAAVEACPYAHYGSYSGLISSHRRLLRPGRLATTFDIRTNPAYRR